MTDWRDPDRNAPRPAVTPSPRVVPLANGTRLDKLERAVGDMGTTMANVSATVNAIHERIGGWGDVIATMREVQSQHGRQIAIQEERQRYQDSDIRSLYGKVENVDRSTRTLAMTDAQVDATLKMQKQNAEISGNRRFTIAVALLSSIMSFAAALLIWWLTK